METLLAITSIMFFPAGISLILGGMVLGVIVVAFPLYITFVASTHTSQDIVQVPMPLLPGPHLVDNYTAAILGTSDGAASTAARKPSRA